VADWALTRNDKKRHITHSPSPSIKSLSFSALSMSSGQISDIDTPDPWMIKFNNKYLLTFTTGNNVTLWSSPLLENFYDSSSTTQQRVLWYSLFPFGAKVGNLPTRGCK
jgi:hypothetical protein